MDNYQNYGNNGPEPQFSGNYQSAPQTPPPQNQAWQGQVPPQNQAWQGQMPPQNQAWAPQPPYGYAYPPVAPKKESKGKSFLIRVLYFLLASGVIAACIVMQVLCAFVVLVAALVVRMISMGVDASNMDLLMRIYMEVALEYAPTGVLAYHIIGTLIFGIWYYFTFKKPRPRFTQSARKLNIKCIVIVLLCGICLCLFANGTVVLESFLTPSIVEDYMEMAEAAGLGVNIWVILASIFLAPIGEEFVCRGLTLKFARKAFGYFWIANIFQALMFGLIHMNWVQGIYAFVIGLVLGWLVERYDTILPAMLLHCVVNLSSSTWIPILLEPVPATLPVGILLTVMPIMVVVLLLVWGGRKPAAASA